MPRICSSAKNCKAIFLWNDLYYRKFGEPSYNMINEPLAALASQAIASSLIHIKEMFITSSITFVITYIQYSSFVEMIKQSYKFTINGDEIKAKLYLKYFFSLKRN